MFILWNRTEETRPGCFSICPMHSFISIPFSSYLLFEMSGQFKGNVFSLTKNIQLNLGSLNQLFLYVAEDLQMKSSLPLNVFCSWKQKLVIFSMITAFSLLSVLEVKHIEQIWQYFKLSCAVLEIDLNQSCYSSIISYYTTLFQHVINAKPWIPVHTSVGMRSPLCKDFA